MIRGVYWITDGDVIFCDGDAGVDVPNHEMIVTTHCMGLVKDAVEGKSETLEELLRQISQDDDVVDLVMLREAMHAAINALHREGKVTDEQANAPESWIREITDLEDWIVACAFSGYDCNYDVRAFAMARWGWIRVQGNNITMQTIDKETCTRLDDGLAEICDQEGMRDYTEYAWNVESVKPGGYSSGISGIFLSDHKTLRKEVVRHFVKGWPSGS